MHRGEKVHKGKAKVAFRTKEAGLRAQYFRDDATAFYGKKRGTVTGRGALGGSG